MFHGDGFYKKSPPWPPEAKRAAIFRECRSKAFPGFTSRIEFESQNEQYQSQFIYSSNFRKGSGFETG
jgi:hypothetical protein